MVTRERLVIVGASGHAREVLDVIEAVGDHEVLGFVDDGEPDLALLAARDVPLLGGSSDVADLVSLDDVVYVLGIGSATTRTALAAELAAHGWTPAGPVVHPLGSIGSSVTLGRGTVIAAGARLTTNISVGDHCYIGPNAVVGHDCVLDEGATVYPGAVVSGNVRLGEAATVGAGATIRQGVQVGAGAFIGLGAAVIADVAPGDTVVGVPARRSIPD